MHLSKLLLLGCITLTTSSLLAQNKPLTMEDAVMGLRGGKFSAETLKQLQWKSNSNHLTQIVGKDKNAALVQQQANILSTDTLLKLTQLNQIIFGKDSLANFPGYIWSGQDELIVLHKQHKFILDQLAKGQWKLKKTISTPSESSNVTWDNAKQQIAYTIGNSLYLIDAFQKSHTVATSSHTNEVIGQSVHRNEFGINNGIFFSPKDNYIAFYKMDESMVTDYPIIDWGKTPAGVNMIKYPMAGQTSHQVSIGVYNIISKQTIYLQIDGPKDQYLTNVSWSPDERYIFVGVLNRAQNHLKWNQYNATTGQFIKTLFEEKNEKYVEPQHPFYFLNEKEFIWLSQRDGYMHAYRYNINGQLLNQVTRGNWIVTSINGKLDEEKQLIITATKEDAREKHLYTVNWTNGQIKRLDKNDGIHNAQVSPRGNYVVDIYQNAQTPRNTDLIDVQKGSIKRLHTSENKLNNYQTAAVENITLKADDGTELYGKLMKPRNFDSNKKYPVIVYLYNGPHFQLITNSYPESGNLWYDYMCQNGYLVFTMDGRGSSNRGFKFESAVHRQLGQVEMKDQLVGINYLKQLPYVDAARMGMHGWSFGGFMTTSFMAQQPGVFKAGVAGGPVIDWGMYEVMYTERYMGTPTNNPKGFELSELSSKADQIKDHLMIIHGADDDVVVLQHAIKILESSVKKGKQLDFYVYPGHKHNVLGKDRVHLMQKVTDYFDLHLKNKVQ